MKKIIIYFLPIFFLTIVSSKIYTQVSAKKNYEDAKLVKESKLMVVLSDVETVIDDSIKSTMKKYWTFCEYDFIKESEYDSYKIQEGYSLLVIMSEAIQGMDINGYSYRIIIGNKKNKNTNPEFVSRVMLPSIKNEKKKIVLNTYDYLIPYIIKKSQTELEDFYNSNGKEIKITKSKADQGDVNTTYSVGGHAKLEKMNLLICKDEVKNIEFAKNMVKKILDIDTSKISFVSSAEISKAIIDKKEDIAIAYADNGGNYYVFSAAELEKLASGICLWIYYGK